MKEYYAFSRQSYGNCGQVSVANCLTILGIPITNKEAHIATGIHPIEAKLRGTDSKYIRRALRYYNCTPIEYNIKDAEELKQKVDKLLNDHIPLILSCDNWEHWTVLGGSNGKNKYFWIDSADSDIIGYSSWNKISNWIECYASYYFIAAIPEDPSKAIIDIPRLYKISCKNEELFLQWGKILADLLDVFESKNNTSLSITAKEFFTKYKNLILKNIEYLYLDTDMEEVTQKLNNYKVVAEMHNLVLVKTDIEKALAYFSTLFTLSAVGIE